MAQEFVIPLSRDDLLNKTAVNQFTVEEILPLRLIPGALQDIKSALRSPKASVAVDHFDTWFSVLCLQKDVSPDLKEDAWNSVVKVSIVHSNELMVELEGPHISVASREQHLLILKATMYLLCQYMEMFEAEDTKPGTSVAGPKGRGKKKQPSDSMSINWEIERERGVQVLLRTVQLPLCRLWDPPIPEEEFVNMITCCCYKLLENTMISRNKDTRDVIIRVLAVMVKKYNHSLGASLKIIQLLQHFEHLVVPLAQAVELISTEYGVKTVVAEIMREIGRMDPKDLVRDTSGTRSYASFLVEIAERVPAVVLTSISVILRHLEGESYSMRNGVLGAMGEILIKVLSKDDLDNKQKLTRDQILDKLEDHIHDVHAFVRSKVLQIWLRVVNEKCLPLMRQENLVNLVIGRLQDKSCQVRKQAIQLITTLLQSNPFAAKLPLEELQLSYEKEKSKLEEMMPEPVSPSPDDTLTEQTTSSWKTIATKLENYLKVDNNDDGPTEESEPSDEEDEADLITEDDTPVSVAEKLCVLLDGEEFKKVLSLLEAAQEAWPDHPYYHGNCQSSEEPEDEAESQTEDTPHTKNILSTLQKVFVDYKKSRLMSASDVVQHQEEVARRASESGVVNELTKQQVLVQYLKDSMTFAAQVQKSIPLLCQLLTSKTTSDVLETIHFYVTAFEFGVNNAIIGVRKMLVLIFSKEASVKEAVVSAYKRLYLTPQAGNVRAKALSIVKNLTALTHGATAGDITSLAELMCEFYRSGEVDGHVIQLLWERFTLKQTTTMVEESRAALVLLSMIAGAETEIVKSNIDVLVKEGLGPRAETDFQLARDTCLVLLKLRSSEKLKGAVSKEPFRLQKDHEMFKRLADILVGGMSNLENPYWIPMAEQAVNVIYRLGEHPDTICSDIIKRLAGEIISASKTETSADFTVEADNNNDDQQPSAEPTQDQAGNGVSSHDPPTVGCPAGFLTRLLSLAGHVAFRQLVYLDCDLFGELKRRHAVQEEKKERKAGRKSPAGAVLETPATCNRSKDNTREGIEEELGLTGAVAEDAEADYIRKICEQDVVTGLSLLAALRPLLVCVCTNQAKYPDPQLRTAACLALAKFMMVSSEFCETHLQLLFTILEKSKNPVIRANTIIALGDMTFRFPNLIEPWTPHLYARLGDPSTQVRKTTLQVLSHLILNDMVKVKGQISELATCIVDDNEKICGLAKLFFSELSKKGNAVYNIMPDVISRLSDPDIGVDEELFRTIMRYLFSFIQKDKHCESLVEKLCHRFRPTRTERQWRDLSFCLSLLSYSEKGLRKLQENFACYADKLADDTVYECFSSILANAKKGFSKPEAKAAAEELEERVEQCHRKGLEEDEVAEKASQASEAASRKSRGKKTPAKGRKAGGKAGRRSTRKKQFVDSEEDEEDNQSEESEVEERAQPKRGGRKTKPVLFDSDEESDLELFEVDKSLRNSDAENEPQTDAVDKTGDSRSLTETPKSHRRGQGSAKTHMSGRKTRMRPLQNLNSPA
ncbi:condensin complex subunit 1-like [Liolophura sinensis]|uniref:condensin complex subunit 1-like n=1 Tax=Liolophura sinensis TaxID=3198878 RepID=UPI00315940E3